MPVIGLTCQRRDTSEGIALQSVVEAYVQAISIAGGIPLIIPLGLPDDSLAAILKRVDGIIFTGGGDIDPAQYGEASNSFIRSVDEDRDREEIILVREVISQEIPFLGICRGLQIINIALGGSLYTHVLDQLPDVLTHDSSLSSHRQSLVHKVTIDPDSHLYKILGVKELDVNSHHHQGIRRKAIGLKTTAISPDGLIEAVEIPGHPFGLAVQWHPEWLIDNPFSLKLFKGFVEAAKD